MYIFFFICISFELSFFFICFVQFTVKYAHMSVCYPPIRVFVQSEFINVFIFIFFQCYYILFWKLFFCVVLRNTLCVWYYKLRAKPTALKCIMFSKFTVFKVFRINSCSYKIKINSCRLVFEAQNDDNELIQSVHQSNIIFF